MKIDPNTNTIFYRNRIASQNLSTEDENKEMRYFFSSAHIDDLELLNSNGKPLFKKILSKFGEIDMNQMYGYKHRLSLGGKRIVSNVEIFDLDAYHGISQKMEEPQIYSY